MARKYDSGSSSDEHDGRRRDAGRDFKIRDVRGRSKYNGVEDKQDVRESERSGNWERRGSEMDSRVRERNMQGREKNDDVIEEKDKQDVREIERMDNREKRGSEIDSRVRDRNGQGGEKNVDDIDEKDKQDVRERERPDNQDRRRGGEIDSRVRDRNVTDKEKNGDAKDGEDSRDEGKRQRKKREGSDGRKHEELGRWMEDDNGRKSPRRRISNERDKRRIDEGKRTRIQGTEEDGGSESSDGEKRRVTDKDMKRGNDRRRGGRRGSPDDSDSENSGGNRRLLDSERHRRDRKGDERRDKEYRGRKDRHDRDEEGDVRSVREKERKNPESKGELRDGRGGEAAKAPSQREPTSVNTNPGGDVATLGRTGGVYIPPFKLARMMKEVEDKSSIEYQRLTWDALRKSINGLVNKVNATNIKNIIPELFSENLIRGRGLYCRSCMKSQMASPGFTDVFSALVAVLNTKFPEIGELLLRRIILQLKRAYKRNDKPQLLAAVKFIAHLVNQQVAHELVALELLTVLLEQPTDDSVEVAVDFVKECGSILQDLCPKGLHGIFERFRGILHEGEIDKRVQFLIEGLFAIRKAKFQGHPAVRPELDLVEPEDQLTHEVSLDDEIDPETSLDIFKQDLNFLENERRYEEVKKSILGEESEDDNASDAGSDDEDDDEDDEDDDDEDEEQMQIKDATETNLINLRRTIYLTIMSSVDFEEAGHKLLKIKLEPGQEMELNIMLLECCSQERTYLRYYGLLGQRFCMVNKVYQENFETCFVQQYSMIHRLETNKLRNVAKFFAHLLGTDALPWHVLAYIRLTEEDTTSSSRIFIKILFQELSEHLGIRLLNDRLNDPAMHDSFESIFPKDNPRNTRFSINFFTSIGLGGITENLREYLKNMPRMIMQQQKPESEEEAGSSSSDSGSSSSESESSSSEDSDSSSDKRRKRRKNDRDDDKQKKRRKRN